MREKKNKTKTNILLSLLTTLLLVVALVGCGTTSAPQGNTPQESETESQQETDSTESTDDLADVTIPEDTAEQGDASTSEPVDTQEETGTGNTLIAYFTWADNTYVENPDAVDVDASTSASVLQPGNVGLIASWIQQEIGGDLFSIQVENLYSSDYDECLDRASEENAEDARPALATHVDNMDQYDTVYIGYPNWWYSCPMALLSFLEEYDFSGKHIILFCSHGTGGLSGSVGAITEVLPEDCTIEENVLGVYRPEVADSQEAVLEWVQEVRTDVGDPS